jgi:cytochrome P450
MPDTQDPVVCAQPRGLPLIGDPLLYLRDPLGYLLRARQRHGVMVRLPLGTVKPIFINHPALIEQVLITDAKHYRKDMFLRRLAQEVVGQGLLTSEGDFWRRQRRLSQPAFHRERIAHYGAMMVECTEQALADFRPGQVRELHEDLMSLTMQIVARTLFSAEVGQMSRDVGRAIAVIMDRYADGLFMLFPATARLPLPMNRRFARAMARLDELIYGVIRARRKPDPRNGEARDSDLLSMLLEARDEDGSGMTDQQLRDEIITLFIAGHETTALTLSYSFVLLSQNPRAAERLHQELGAVLGGRLPTAQDVPALRYTEAVVLESLRLYPPAWTLGREVMVDLQIGGTPIRAGDLVAMSPFVMHRDPAYFPDPEAFLPERWEDGLQKRLPRFAYFPFGGGPRLCIGNAFAMMEATLVLATIARRFRLQVQLDRPPRLLPSITLRPGEPIRARVESVANISGRSN